MKKWQKIMFRGSSRQIRKMWVELNKWPRDRFVMN